MAAEQSLQERVLLGGEAGGEHASHQHSSGQCAQSMHVVSKPARPLWLSCSCLHPRGSSVAVLSSLPQHGKTQELLSLCVHSCYFYGEIDMIEAPET